MTDDAIPEPVDYEETEAIPHEPMSEVVWGERPDPDQDDERIR